MFMIRVIYFLLLISFLSISEINAQSIRGVLVEEGTNASCGPCATQNPAFKAWINKNLDRVIPIVYHAWWPGSQDPMYLYDTDMNRTRIQYYEMSGVPSGRIAGKVATPTGKWYAGAVGDTSALSSELKLMSFYSPIGIKVELKHKNASGTVKIEVSSSANISNKKLRVVICELHHYYANAGSNGEKDFHYIARRMLPDANGTTISLNAGESKNYEFPFSVDPAFADDLYAVAFIQDDLNKEVFQTASTMETPATRLPEYSLMLNQFDMFFVAKSGDEYYLDARLINNTDKSVNFIINAYPSESTPDDWNSEVIGDKTTVTVNPNSTEMLKAKFIVGNKVGIGELSLNCQVQGRPISFNTSNLILIHESVDRFHILGGEDDHSILPIIDKTYKSAKFYHLKSQYFEQIYQQFNSLKTIIWNGSTTGAVTPSVGNVIKYALQNGVNVLICGGAIAAGLNSTAILPQLGLQFIAYCREGYGTAPNEVTLAGVEDEPISFDFGDNVKGNLIRYLLPLFRITNTSMTSPVMTFKKSKDSIFAIKTQLPKSRAVLLGLNPYILLDQSIRDKLISRSITWLEGGTTDVEVIENTNDFDIWTSSANDKQPLKLFINSHRDYANLNFYLVGILGNRLSEINYGELKKGLNTFDINPRAISRQPVFLVCEIDGQRTILNLTLLE